MCQETEVSISSDDSIVDASVEFQDWYEVHEALGCTLNRTGSSPAMEVDLLSCGIDPLKG